MGRTLQINVCTLWNLPQCWEPFVLWNIPRICEIKNISIILFSNGIFHSTKRWLETPAGIFIYLLYGRFIFILFLFYFYFIFTSHVAAGCRLTWWKVRPSNLKEFVYLNWYFDTKFLFLFLFLFFSFLFLFLFLNYLFLVFIAPPPGTWNLFSLSFFLLPFSSFFLSLQSFHFIFHYLSERI